jgi:hypothetical protein
VQDAKESINGAFR